MPTIDTSKLNTDTYFVKDNTFFAVEKYNPMDLVEKEIGDSKVVGEFLPQQKITRWDNEVNFSARLVHDEKTPTVSTLEDKIVWDGEKVAVNFYDIFDEANPEGASEFEVILKEKPKTNVVSFTIQTKGLDFFYQPDERNIPEVKQPENVVGSYAVYASENKTNYVGGKEYKCGKVGHIYRPRIEDAEKNWVWGELNVDTQNGILSVTIPKEFLDKAVYPVRHAAGLTFGYTTAGSSYESSSTNVANVYRFTSPSDIGDVSSMSCHIRAIMTGAVAKYVFWTAPGGVLVTNGVSNATGKLTFPRQWRTATVSTSPTLSASTDYFIGAIGSNNIEWNYDTGGTTGYSWRQISNSYESPADISFPISFYNEAKKRSIYATYTAGGGATDVTVTQSAPEAYASAQLASTTSITRNVSLAQAIQSGLFSTLAATITAESPNIRPFNPWKKNQINGGLDLDTNTIKMALVTSSYTFNKAHEFFSDITNEITGTGYTEGGAEITSKQVTADNTDNEGVFSGADVTWSGASFTARGAVLYKSTGTASTSPLIYYYDFGGDKVLSNQNLTIQWNVEGIINLN